MMPLKDHALLTKYDFCIKIKKYIAKNMQRRFRSMKKLFEFFLLFFMIGMQHSTRRLLSKHSSVFVAA